MLRRDRPSLRPAGHRITPVSILLLRHGQSEWNAVQRWQGTADSPLTELGRSQARATAFALAGLDQNFQSIWSSDLSRAAETATIIGELLGIGAPRLDPRLREAHAGEWEGLTPNFIEEHWPGWLAEHRRPPSFESFDDVVTRSLGALADIAQAAGPSDPVGRACVLTVAHSGMIRSVIRHLGGTDERVPNLGGVWLDVAGRSSTGVAAFQLRDVFDPTGIAISGIDAPGEDPGDQTDHADGHGSAER
jgi:broad specificity phosphatase PhoE